MGSLGMFRPGGAGNVRTASKEGPLSSRIQFYAEQRANRTMACGESRSEGADAPRIQWPELRTLGRDAHGRERSGPPGERGAGSVDTSPEESRLLFCTVGDRGHR